MRALREDLDVQGASNSLTSGRELESALAKGLDLPLTALRACVESLCSTLRDDTHGQHLVDGLLQEVERLGRNVRELMEYATAPVPRPLRCTGGEIALSARGGLAPELRSRVLIAFVGEDSARVVDGPLVARVLQRLIENALEAGSDQVLLVVRQNAGCMRFSVVDAAPQPFDVEWAVPPFHSTRNNQLGLGLALIKRDLALVAGTLELRCSPNGETCASVTVPEASQDDQEG